jgi:hypothetical protein
MVSSEELITWVTYIIFGIFVCIPLYLVWDMRPSNIKKSFGIPKILGSK